MLTVRFVPMLGLRYHATWLQEPGSEAQELEAVSSAGRISFEERHIPFIDTGWPLKSMFHVPEQGIFENSVLFFHEHAFESEHSPEG